MPQAKREELPGLVTATSILAGGAIAALVCILVTALCAWLVSAGHLGAAWLDRGTLAGLFTGALIGGGYAVQSVGRRALPVGIAAGTVMVALFLLAEVLNPAAVPGERAVSAVFAALLGGALAGVLFSGGKKRRK